MQNHINSKDAQVTLVKGVVVTDLTDSNSIQIGDVINAGTAIFFSEGSEIVLTFDDGSQQRVYSTSNEVDSEASVEIVPPGDKFVVKDGDATSDVQNEISAIQDLIDSGEDIEGPETAAGLTGNEGTSFVALNRVGDETLAQAGYDTSEQEGIVTNNNDRENLDNAAFRPVLTDAAETITIDEDTTATGNVLDNASSPDGPLSVTSFTIDGITYAIGETASLPSGDFTLNADGSYSFIPAENYNGDVPVVTYTVLDGAGDTVVSTLVIDITPVSDIVDSNESITIDEDTTATGNVLNNADSPDGPLSVTSFTIDGVTYAIGDTASLPSGEFTLNADGSYSFVPAANYNGAVPVVTYTVLDGAGDTVESSLTIAITPVADLTDNSESITIDEDTTATGNVLDNADSPDGPLSVTSFTLDTGDGTQTSFNAGDTATIDGVGTITLNADGSYSFVPAANYNGDVPVVTYTVLDGAGDTVVSTLTIDIEAVSDISDSNESITIDEDTTATGNVLDNADSPDGPLSVTSFTIDGVTYAIGDTASLPSGEFTLNADGSYTFIPAANYNGAVPVVTYTVLDGAGDTVESSLTIAITPVADLTDNSESITIDEDTTATGNVLDNADSPDGPLSVTSFTLDTGDGTQTSFNAGDTATIDGVGTITLNADGSYSFVPAANYNGDVPVVTYTVLDGAGDTVVSTLTIDIEAVSDISDSNESITIDEDTTATGNVLDNADSPDGPLSVTSFTIDGVTYAIGDTASLPSGEFTLNADGSYTFIPAENYNGDVPVVTYTVLDGAGDTVESSLTIAITPVADLTDNSESFTVPEDTGLTGNVLNNASSPDGPLSVTSFTIDGVTYAIGDTATLPSGEFTLNADGSYSFVPAANYNGAVPVVTYTVLDGAGDTVVSTLTIDIEAVSDISDSNESITIDEDTTATGNVLDNADSPDGPLSVTSFTIDGVTYAIGDTASLPSGEFTLNADGSYTFIPAENYNGDVPVVTYTVLDGAGDTVESSLTIAITPVADLTDNSESITIDEDTTATGNVLDNADSPDGPLSVTSFTIDGVTYAIGDTASLPSGEFTLNADGSYSFVPAANYNGAVPVVTYTVLDGAGDTVVSTLTIDIEAVSDISDSNESITIDEDTTATGNVLDNADSPDGPLSVTSFTIDGVTYAIGDTASLPSGEFTLNADGSYTFIPAENYNGDVPVVTYTVLDGAGDTVESSLTIAITPVADLTDNSESFTVPEDTGLTGNVLNNASSPDGPLSVTSFTIDGVTYAIGDTATLPSGEFTLNADGSYSFVPAANYNGAVPIVTYTVLDGAGDTIESSLTIAITPVSDIVDSNESITIDEDTNATGNVLNNADSPDGPLSVTSFTLDTGDGTQTSFNAGDTATIDGVGTITLNADGSYSFVPAANYNGAVPVVTYTVLDGAGDTVESSLTIAITPVADLTDNSESFTVPEDTGLTGNVLNNASSPDGPLSVTSFTLDTGDGTQTSFNAGDTATIDGVGSITLNADGSYTFIPAENYNGDVPVVTYTVLDGAGDTVVSTLTIDIEAVSDISDSNESITIDEDTTATGNVLDNADSPDGPLSVTSFTIDGVTYAIGDTASLPSGEFTLNADGNYTFVPAANYNGAVPVVTYTVLDGAGDTVESSLTIAITPVSDIVDSNESITIDEDTNATGNVLNNASSPDGPLSVTSFTIDGVTYAIGDTATLPSGEFTLNADGSYSFVPAANYNGAVPVVTYTVLDGAGDTVESSLTIAITPVADLTDNSESFTVPEDTGLTGNVLNNASSPDGPLSVTSFTLDTGDGTQTSFNAGDTATIDGVGSITLNADGSYTFIPAENYNGDVPVVTYTVLDGAGDTVVSTLTIDIEAVSDISDSNESVTIDEDTTATGNVLNNASSPDGPLSVTSFTIDGVTYAIGDTATLPSGEFTLNADGSYSFVPAANYNGAVPIVTYTVLDGAGDTIESSLTIAITPVSDIVDSNESITIDEDTNATGNVLNNADSPDGPLSVTSFTIDGVTYAIGDTASLPSGEFTLNANGNYTFVPAANYNGDVPVVTYTVLDGAGDTVESSLTIAITPVADLTDNSESFTVLEDTGLTGNVLNNASSPDGPLSVTSFTLDTGDGTQTSFNAGDTATIDGVGTITLNANGNYTFVPAANYNGAVPVVTYTVLDGAGDTVVSTLTIDIEAVSDISDSNESITIDEDTTATGNVLDNASSPDGPLSVTSFTLDTGDGTQTSFNAGDTADIPGVGSITLNADGSYTFIPAENYNGDVPVVTYTVLDGAGDTVQSTLTTAIIPVDDASNTTADTGVTEEDTTLIVSAADGVLSNDSDIDNDLTVATFTVDTGTGAQTSFNAGDTATIDGVGSITLNADGSYTFVPVANYDGDVPVVTYTTNTGSSDTLSIEITPVDDASSTVADTGVTEEDTTLNVTAADGVLSNDSDIDSDLTVATFTVDTGTGAQTSFNAGDTATIDGVGSITLNADGSYTFVPVANYDGDVPVVTYTTNTGSSDTLSIEITPVDDASNTTADTGVTEEDTTLIVSAADGVLSNDSDIDNDLTVATFTVDTGTGAQTSFNAGDTATIDGVGSITLNADGSYTFVPVANYDGDVPVVTYTTNTGSSDTLSIEITPVDDASSTVADTGVTEEDTTLNVTAADGVLSNDSDIDSDLTVATFTVDTGTGAQTSFNAGDTADIPGVGSITLNADGSYTFEPAANYDGDVPVVTYTTNTGSSDTLSIEITPVDDASSTVADTGVTEEDTTLNVTAADGVLSNDSDIDSDLTVATFTVDTGTGAQTSFNAGDTATIDGVGSITLNADGSYTFVPVANYDGDVPVVTYTTNTGSSDTLSIEITPVDDASNTTADTGVTEEDTTLIVSAADGVLSNDSDIDNDLTVATFTVDTGTGAQTSFNAGDTADIPGVGSITLNADGSYTFVPVANYDGDVPVVTYTTNTGSSDTLSLSINPINDAPTATDDSFVIVSGKSVSGNIISHHDGDFVTDSDVDGDTLTVTQVNGVNLVFDANDSGYATIAVEGGTLRINAEGDFTYSFTGEDGFVIGVDTFPTFEYTLTDGQLSDIATVTIDFAPDAVDDVNAVFFRTSDSDNDGLQESQSSSVRGNILKNGSSSDNADSSPDDVVYLTKIEFDGNTYTFDNLNTTYDIEYLVNGVVVGVLRINNTGKYTFKLNAGVDVEDIPNKLVFTYTIKDGDTLNAAETDEATLTIHLKQIIPKSKSNSILDESESIDISYQDENIDVVIDDQYAAEVEPELSDLFATENAESLDLYLGQTSTQDGDLDIVENITNSENPIPDDIVLDDAVATVANLQAEKTITNGFLIEGATLIGDGAVERPPQQVDLDSNDI